MIITDRPRSDVVMDLDSKVNKSTLKLTINSDLSHKWLYAWLRHKHMQYELGRISIAICVSGRRLSTRRYISTIEPKRTLSGTWGPKTLRSFTPSYCGPCSKSQIEYLRACAVSLANICNNWRRTSWKSIAYATWHGCILASLLQLDNELLSKRTRNWLRKNDEPSAPRTETSWMLKGCYYQRKPMRCLWRRTYVSIPGRRQLLRTPREITMRTWIDWMRSKTSVPLRRLDPRLSYTWLGTVQGKVISTWYAIFDEQTSEKSFDYDIIYKSWNPHK